MGEGWRERAKAKRTSVCPQGRPNLLCDIKHTGQKKTMRTDNILLSPDSGVCFSVQRLMLIGCLPSCEALGTYKFF